MNDARTMAPRRARRVLPSNALQGWPHETRFAEVAAAKRGKGEGEAVDLLLESHAGTFDHDHDPVGESLRQH